VDLSLPYSFQLFMICPSSLPFAVLGWGSLSLFLQYLFATLSRPSVSGVTLCYFFFVGLEFSEFSGWLTVGDDRFFSFMIFFFLTSFFFPFFFPFSLPAVPFLLILPRRLLISFRWGCLRRGRGFSFRCFNLVQTLIFASSTVPFS